MKKHEASQRVHAAGRAGIDHSLGEAFEFVLDLIVEIRTCC